MPLLLVLANIYCILPMCQVLGKGFWYTISFSTYSNPTKELLIVSSLSIRGKFEVLEFAWGFPGRREQDGDLNPDLQLQSPGSQPLNTDNPFGSLLHPAKQAKWGWEERESFVYSQYLIWSLQSPYKGTSIFVSQMTGQKMWVIC